MNLEVKMVLQVKTLSTEGERRRPGRPKGSRDKAPRKVKTHLGHRTPNLHEVFGTACEKCCASPAHEESVMFASANVEFSAEIPDTSSPLYDDPFYWDWAF